MAVFHLQIVTPDGLSYDGMAEKLIVRTIGGDVCILAGHINFVSPLGMGIAKVVTAEGERTAACIGGMLSVIDGRAELVPTTFEWREDIDTERAARSRERAEAELQNRASMSKDAINMAEARLRRALVRLGVAGK